MAAKIQNAAKIENPFRVNGSYWTVVEVLRRLGIGKMHSAEKIVETYPKIAAENFKAFKGKEKRTEDGKDWKARVIQNCIVVNRNDYGLPLRQVGFEVAKNHGDNGYQFGLMPISKAAAMEAQKATIERTPKAPKARKAAPKGKTPQNASQTPRKASVKTQAASVKSDDAVSALVKLGTKRNEAEQLTAKARLRGAKTTEQIIKIALAARGK